MPRPRARCATALPILPTPIIPNVLPRILWIEPGTAGGQPPAIISPLNQATRREADIISAITCSATSIVPYPGAFAIATPSSDALAKSIWSYPTPQRTANSKFGRASITDLVIPGFHASQRIFASCAPAISSSSVTQFPQMMLPPTSLSAAFSKS